VNFPGVLCESPQVKRLPVLFHSKIAPARSLPKSLTTDDSDACCAVENKREVGKMKTLKVMTLATVVAMLVTGFTLISAAARANQEQFDAAATFKAKCVACHGAAAEKKFDATIPDADLVQIVLNGKKPEKPPNMPAYAEKGITEDQAKALVAHMKSLKK
jgi:mono/diheme cytochrome c family protein